MDETRMDERCTELAGIIGRHAPTEGRSPTELPGVEVFRIDEPTPIRCSIYEPCVIIVAQGAKRAILGDDVFEYSPRRYLVLPISLPVNSHVIRASPSEPFLSFAIRVDPVQLGQVVLDAGDDEPLGRQTPRGIAVSEVDDALLDAALRLMRTLDHESDRRVLGAGLVREVLYRVLTGPQGRLLRAAGSREGRVNQIARALTLIHSEYERPIEVSELARAAHMSGSTFHEAFKAFTSLTPVQYLKEIRLNRARQIMVWEGVSAKRAAAEVGYASASQFSREFKRRFGRPPARERAWAIETGEVVEPLPA